MKPFYLGLITARGGSKRIPRKNLVPLGGKPLIAHTIEAALASKKLSRVIVSTDDEEIAAIARRRGAEVPFLRPASLARDRSSSLDVVLHALREVEKGGMCVDAVVLLQPTSPFRGASLIDDCVRRFERTRADTLTTVHESLQHPYHAWRQLPDGRIETFHSRRYQSAATKELPKAVAENGAVYIVRRSTLARGSFYGRKVVAFPTDCRTGVDIDTSEDLEWARHLAKTSRWRA